MFKGRATRKALMQAMKKSPAKDVTGWCSKNLPCPEDDRPTNTITEFNGQPSRMTQREVNMLGLMPFSFDGKDLSEWVLEFLDIRRVTLDPVQKSLVQRDTSFVRATLVRTNFRGSVCSRTSFERANAELASFNSTVLIFCTFDGAVLKKASFVAANAEHASFREVIAQAANFQQANLEYSSLNDAWFCSREYYSSSGDKSAKSEYSLANWAGASFVNARLRGADLRGAKLCGADLSGANLSCASLQNADLRGANLTGAKLCGANLIHANLNGVRGLDKADLTWAVVLGGLTIDQDLEAHKDASKILMSRASVERWASELSEVNFSNTDLSDFTLPGCRLVGCFFRGSDLRHTNFGGANLTGADFSQAELFNADLSGAMLASTKFTGADMRNTNLSGVDLMQIKDALLEAKTLAGMTCTMGMVPEELKARGVLDSEDKGSMRVNTQALEAAEQRIREERKQKLEAEKRQKALDAEAASIDRLENTIQQTSFSRVGPQEFPLLRLRLLATVLKERTLNLTPTSQDERDERWAAFNDTFGMARGSPTLKKLYLSLVTEDIHDEWLVMVWRRTKDVKVQRMGTLENLALEAMIRSRDWSQWAPDVYRMLASKEKDKNFAPEYTQYLQLLFKSKAVEAAAAAAAAAAASTSATTATTSPSGSPEFGAEDFVPPPPGDPDVPPGSPPIGAMGSLSPHSTQSPLVQHRASFGRPGPGMRIGGTPPTSSPLATTSPLMAPSPSAAPATAAAPFQMMQPPGMAAPLPPGQQPPQGMAPMAPSPLMGNVGGIGVGGMSPMGMGMGMQPMGMQPMGMGMQPMGMGMQPMGMGMQPMGMGMQPMGMGMQPMGMGMQPMGMQAMVGPPAGGPQMMLSQRSGAMGMPRSAAVARVKCVECGMVLDANFIQAHKRECRMRLVSCAQCRYSMRYVQWDNHNRFCNTAGPCPICGKQIRDNIVVHLYERHMQELGERGFFCGAEPPTKMK